MKHDWSEHMLIIENRIKQINEAFMDKKPVKGLLDEAITEMLELRYYLRENGIK